MSFNLLRTRARIRAAVSGLFFFMVVVSKTSAFTYTNFASITGLNLVDGAAQLTNVLRLTPASREVLGAVWYSQKQSCASGFSTSFRFRITDPGSLPGVTPAGDGIAFSVQNISATTPGSETGPFSNSVAISLNTFYNGGAEPSANFVGIVTNHDNGGNAIYYYTRDLNPTPIRLKDGNEHTALIQYNGSLLNISIDGQAVIVNLPLALGLAVDSGGNGFVGMSARTGWAWENHDILDWTFTAGLTPTNRPPVAQPQTITLNEDSSATLILGASDPDGDTLSYSTSLPTHGSLTGTAPNLVYQPAPNYFGPDSFTFKVNDGNADSAPATVSILVLAVNDPPIAVMRISPLFQFPGISNLLVLAPLCDTNAEVVFDASGSSDIENDPLTFTWWESTNVFASGVITTNPLSLGWHLITLSVSDGTAGASQMASLQVAGPSDLVGVLIGEVEDSRFPGPEQQPLIASLRAAAASFERCNLISGVNQLQAVQHKLRARQEVFGPEFVQHLGDQIETIIRSLNGE